MPASRVSEFALAQEMATPVFAVIVADACRTVSLSASNSITSVCPMVCVPTESSADAQVVSPVPAGFDVVILILALAGPGVNAVPVLIMISVGSSNSVPVSPLGARVSTLPLNPRLCPDTSTNPPSPERSPPFAEILP